MDFFSTIGFRTHHHSLEAENWKLLLLLGLLLTQQPHTDEQLDPTILTVVANSHASKMTSTSLLTSNTCGKTSHCQNLESQYEIV